MITRRDGRLFSHPYTLGVMPDHPSGYTGLALYLDARFWVMSVRTRRPDGQTELHTTRRSRFRIVALLNALLGRFGQVGTGAA